MAGLPFDVQGARAAGYSDDQIINELQQSGKVPFDFAGALKSGHSSTDILNEVSPQTSGYIADVEEGAGKFGEGVGNTLNKMGFTNAGPALAAKAKSIEPDNYSAPPIFSNDSWVPSPSGIAHTLARGAVPAATSILGAGLAAPLGPAAVIAGGAIPGALADTGNEIDKTGSTARGIAAGVLPNLVSALPVGKFLGGGAAAVDKVGWQGVKAAGERLANTALSQGLASGAGTATENAISDGSINLKDVASSAVGGAAGATLFAGARKTIPEVLDALHYSKGGNAPEDIQARQMAASRVLDAAGNDRLQGRLLGNSQIQRNGEAAVNIARLGVNNDLSDAMADFNTRSKLPSDAQTVLGAAMSGTTLPNARGYQVLQAGLGNDPQAPRILNLVRQQAQLNLVGGHVVNGKLTGGAGGLMHSFLTPEHLLKTGLVGLLGAGEEGAGHVIAFSPTTLGAAGVGGAGLRLLDNMTGAQAPAGRFTRNFATPGGPTNVPVNQPPVSAPAPMPGVRPGLPSLPPNSGSVAPAPWGPTPPPTINPNALPTNITKPARALMRGAMLAQKMRAAANDALTGEGGGDATADQDDDNARRNALANPIPFDATKTGSGVPLTDNYSVMHVDPRVLMRAHGATDADMASYQKTAGVRNYVSNGGTLAMPEVGASNGRLGFTNGRNRAAVAAMEGNSTIPIAVDKDNAQDVQSILGKFATPQKIAKANGTTQVDGDEFPPSSYAHLPVDQAGDAILKAANIGGKGIAFQGGYKAGVVNRLTAERAAMDKIGQAAPALAMMPASDRTRWPSLLGELKARLEGTSSQTNAKSYREVIRKAYPQIPQLSDALDKYLSDDVIQGLWRKKGS